MALWGTKHASYYVEQCIESFRQGVKTILKDMSLEDFENFKSSLIKLKETKDLTLYDEVYRNWSEITNEEYLFEHRFKEIHTLRVVEKQDILEFWLKNENQNFRKLSIQVMGCTAAAESLGLANEFINDSMELEFFNDKDDSTIRNITEFKDKLCVYPVTKTEVK